MTAGLYNKVHLKHVGNGYHCALMKDYKHPEHIIFQMRRSVDFLDCEIWEYLGLRMTTKKYVKENKAALLQAINQQYKRAFTKITID